jgi:sporulation protein YlmC with PRC-barrel domain
MPRNLSLGPIATCVYLALTGLLLAAQTAGTETANPPATEGDIVTAKSADVCREDLKAFSHRMENEGYWVAGDGYSLGYPMVAGGFGMYGGMTSESSIRARAAFVGPGFYNGRPGYELRALVASANVLARHGQQQPCEDVLAATRGLYASYLSYMQKEGAPPVDMPSWRQRQIASAVPVTESKVAFRSDELLSVEVRSPDGVALGSVDDLVLSPLTERIAYLVIARGGIFGLDETRIPIPWDDFKATPNATLLVLDTTKGTLEAAPTVAKNSFSISSEVGSLSGKVDTYWKANQPAKASN